MLDPQLITPITWKGYSNTQNVPHFLGAEISRVIFSVNPC